MTRNKLIAFCYLFIFGVGFAMLHTAGPEALPFLWGATALLGLATIATFAFVYSRPKSLDEELSTYGPPPPDRKQVTLWILLLLTSAVFGYTRYIAFIQAPDSLVGTLSISQAGQSWIPGKAISQTAFLKIKTLAPVTEEIKLRLVGQLEAMQPVLDANGVPVLGADGRWSFTQYNVSQTSEDIVIPAGTAARAELLIEQPFTHLDKVELINKPMASAKIAVMQPENNVNLFARSGRNVVPVSVLGHINTDPWVYSFKTILSIKPDYIQYQPDGPYLPVDRQNVRITIDPTTPEYERYACSDAYGYDIFATGELLSAPHASNKASFDQANYLRSYNIGGQMRLRIPRTGPSPIHIVLPQGSTEPRKGNGLVEFSLYLRDEIVRVIKQTTPQPNSAFHGALTLGLRYGMQSTISIGNDMYDSSPVPPLIPLGKNTNRLITDEFRFSGINHVLAVSGLHVTIITVLFMGIFIMLKVSKKVYVPIIVFALVVFAIITGARPSTLRAVIMNSLFLLTWGYMSESVRSSALLGVPVAALMILLQNPAMAVDPSFTLSFMAILALALMTQPFFDLFKRLQGNDFAVLVILLSVLTWAFAAHWFLVITWRFWIAYTLLGVALFMLSHFLTRKGFKPLGDYGLANVNAGVAGFFAAQFGIQIGMMFPLSPFYFSHWPVAGAYANLIAIPLVGVVLQLSMLAGLLGIIPGIGIYLALVLSAANWIFSIGFLLIGHYFSRWFIYPFMIKPTVFDTGFYFCIVSLFVWWKPLWFRIVRPAWRSSSRSRLMVYFALLVLIGAGVACKRHAEKQLMRPDGKLEISVMSVGYASGIFVDTPDHHAILIDTGLTVTNPTFKIDAERTILPYIYSKQISQLDSLVVTSPKHEYSDGLWSVLFYIDTQHFFYPACVAPLVAQPRIANLLDERSAKYLKYRLSDTLIAPKQIAAGDVIYQSEYEGKPVLIEAVGPAAGDDQTPLSIRIQFGNFSMLIPSDLNFEQQKAFLANTPPEKLKVDVVVAPHHGTAGLETITVGMPDDMQQRIADISGPFYKATGAGAVIFEFGNPRSVEPLLYKEARKIYGLARRGAEDILPKAINVATDTDGAIQISSDGSTYHVYTQLSETGSEMEEPSILETGGW